MGQIKSYHLLCRRLFDFINCLSISSVACCDNIKSKFRTGFTGRGQLFGSHINCEDAANAFATGFYLFDGRT